MAGGTLQNLYSFKRLGDHESGPRGLQLLKNSAWRIHKVPPNVRSKCEKNQVKPFKLTGKWLAELFKICTALNDRDHESQPRGLQFLKNSAWRIYKVLPNFMSKCENNHGKRFKVTDKWLGELIKIGSA